MAKASTSKKTKTSAKRKPGGSASAKARAGKSGKSKKKVAAAAKKPGKSASAVKKTSKQKASRKTTSRKKASKQKASKQKVSKQKVSKQKVSKKTTSRQKTSKQKVSKKTAIGASPRRAGGTSKSRVSAAKSAAPARGTKAGKPAPKPRTKQPSKSAPATAAPAVAVASKSAARKKAAEAVQKSASGKGAPAPAAPEPVMVSVEDAMASLPYVEGQFVVHPKYGLGRVNRILERKLSTRTVPCLEIGFSYQEMKLTIPVDQVDRSGLRRPIGKKSIDDVFKVLRGRATFDAKRRSAKRVVDYRKRLGQGDPTSLAEAVRDLARLSLRKSLSYEERKILSTALRILSREVALARGREPDDVREEIEKIVYR